MSLAAHLSTVHTPPRPSAALRASAAGARAAPPLLPPCPFRRVGSLAQVLRCGHTLHRSCLEKYLAHGGYTCPLCCESVCDMQNVWDSYEDEIAITPMPPELSGRQVSLLCNDCHEQSEATFHFLGLKCGHCGSFNTRRL